MNTKTITRRGEKIQFHDYTDTEREDILGAIERIERMVMALLMSK